MPWRLPSNGSDPTVSAAGGDGGSGALLDRIVYAAPDRVRAGWRIVLFLLAGLAASNVLVPLVRTVLPAAVVPWVGSALECGALLLATRYALATFERGDWAVVALGRRAWRPTPLVLGAMAGAAAIGLPTVLLIAHGDLAFVGVAGTGALHAALLSVAVLAPAAMTEELLLRGYPFAVLSATWGWPAATAVTSVVFGLLHVRNPGVSAIAIANVISAGVFLAGVRLLTGSLAAAWAAHFAWNWTMLGGFHTAVSGLPFEVSGYRLDDAGPDWLSGGAWGPEGGVVAALGMIGAFAGLAWATSRTRSAGQAPGSADTASLNVSGPSDRWEQTQ